MKNRMGLLLLTAVGVIGTVPLSAAPMGTLNIDSCSGGVIVTQSSINFASSCIGVGAGTNFSFAGGTLIAGDAGTIFNLADPFPPGTTFFSFDSGNLLFEPTSLGPGFANTNCGAPPCSIVNGSPFRLVDNVSFTTVSLPVFGQVADADGISTFIGGFSANFAGLTPAQVQAAFFANGNQLAATTFSGSFVVTPIPEPGTVAMAGIGLALLSAYRLRRNKFNA